MSPAQMMKQQPSMILGFPDYEPQGRRLAQSAGLPYQTIRLHRFPDGESKVTVPAELPERLVLCRSLDHPNDKLVELLLAAQTLREAGARDLTLVAPYLCYMRQDIAFHPGEAVSQRIVGRFLGELFDTVITVDPHLHRTPSIEAAIPARRACALTATKLMGRFLDARRADTAKPPLLVGPDGESEQWVRAIAEPAGLDFVVATKERLGDHSVRVNLPAHEFRGREIILVDDMVSTGHTLAEVARELRAAGAGPIRCLVTHALFAHGAEQMLHEAGVEAIWSSDSVTHPTNALPLAELLAQSLTRD